MCSLETYHGGRWGRRWAARATAANGTLGHLHFGVHILALVIVRVVVQALLLGELGEAAATVPSGAAGDPSACVFLAHVVEWELFLSLRGVRWRVLCPICVVGCGVGDLFKVGVGGGAVVERWAKIESNLSGRPHQPSWRSWKPFFGATASERLRGEAIGVYPQHSPLYSLRSILTWRAQHLILPAKIHIPAVLLQSTGLRYERDDPADVDHSSCRHQTVHTRSLARCRSQIP